jgi:hypothetical protein
MGVIANFKGSTTWSWIRSWSRCTFSWMIGCGNATGRQVRLGRPTLLSESEVLTLAIFAQWPRFRNERDFWRFADAHLRDYFPNVLSLSQLNRRIRVIKGGRAVGRPM